MLDDARFGLSLSLVEALRADPSPDAATLVALLGDDHAPERAPACRRPAGGRRWRAALAGLAVTVGVGAAAQSFAATPSLEGRWTMAAGQSRFEEAVTGPAPDSAVVVVTRDDARRLAYRLIERRRGAEVARGDYDVSFAGAASTSAIDGAKFAVTAVKDADGEVTIAAPPVGGLQALIRMRRTGPDTALMQHDVLGAGGATTVETISLVRTIDAAD